MAILEQLTPEVYTRWESIGQRVEDEFLKPAAKQGWSYHRVGSMWTLFFQEQTPNDFASVKAGDLDRFAHFFRSGAKKWDLFAGESIRSRFFLSAAMTYEETTQLVEGLTQISRDHDPNFANATLRVLPHLVGHAIEPPFSTLGVLK